MCMTEGVYSFKWRDRLGFGYTEILTPRFKWIPEVFHHIDHGLYGHVAVISYGLLPGSVSLWDCSMATSSPAILHSHSAVVLSVRLTVTPSALMTALFCSWGWSTVSWRMDRTSAVPSSCQHGLTGLFQGLLPAVPPCLADSQESSMRSCRKLTQNLNWEKYPHFAGTDSRTSAARFNIMVVGMMLQGEEFWCCHLMSYPGTTDMRWHRKVTRHWWSLREPVLATTRSIVAIHQRSSLVLFHYEDRLKRRQNFLYHNPFTTSTGFTLRKQKITGRM